MNDMEGSGALLPTVTSYKTREEDNEDLDDYTDEYVDNVNHANDNAIHNVPNTFVWNISKEVRKNHSFLLPRDIRGIIVSYICRQSTDICLEVFCNKIHFDFLTNVNQTPPANLRNNYNWLV